AGARTSDAAGDRMPALRVPGLRSELRAAAAWVDAWQAQHGALAGTDLRAPWRRYLRLGARPQGEQLGGDGGAHLQPVYREESPREAQPGLPVRPGHRRAHPPQGPALRHDLLRPEEPPRLRHKPPPQ